MRLKILDSGYSFGTKVLFAMIHAVSRHPVPDAAKIVFFRPEFYGAVKFTHQAMGGPSEWLVGDRELMAAYVSKMNACSFCIGAHTATADRLADAFDFELLSPSDFEAGAKYLLKRGYG